MSARRDAIIRESARAITGRIAFPDQPLQLTANPMTAVYGTDPEGRNCSGCVFLVSHQMGHRFYKCEKRGITHGASTDHRVKWPACTLYSPRPDAEPHGQRAARRFPIP